jgi:hypothetical protein
VSLVTVEVQLHRPPDLEGGGHYLFRSTMLSSQHSFAITEEKHEECLSGDTSDSQGGEYEDDRLLGCSVVWSHEGSKHL